MLSAWMLAEAHAPPEWCWMHAGACGSFSGRFAVWGVAVRFEMRAHSAGLDIQLLIGCASAQRGHLAEGERSLGAQGAGSAAGDGDVLWPASFALPAHGDVGEARASSGGRLGSLGLVRTEIAAARHATSGRGMSGDVRCRSRFGVVSGIVFQVRAAVGGARPGRCTDRR